MKIMAGFIVLVLGILLQGAVVNAKDKLSDRQIAIIPIAAFTATGDTESLTKAMEDGLDTGLAINDVKEILTQMYAYAGFPRSITATATFMKLLEERKKDGKNDKTGPEPKELPANADRNAIGTKIQTELVGAPVAGPLFEFAPAIDAFLKEHLFCDIFMRGILTNQEREIATIAALAALPAPEQLASHLKISMNTGITAPQLREYIDVLKEKVGKEEATLASVTLEKISPHNK